MSYLAARLGAVLMIAVAATADVENDQAFSAPPLTQSLVIGQDKGNLNGHGREISLLRGGRSQKKR
jgi:hypothetical protein